MNEKGIRQALRPSAGKMLSFTIADEIVSLKAKPDWATANRLAASLVKDDALNILLLVLKKGARLPDHRTKGPITVQVVSGSIRFSTKNESAELRSGSIVALDRNVIHELEALDESVVLLTTAIE